MRPAGGSRPCPPGRKNEYRPGAQHANVDGISRQCGQCRRPDCPVSSSDSSMVELDSSSVLQDQPFASSEMGDSMDADLLPELSGEIWVASALLEELSVDLPTAGSDIDLIVASRKDATLTTVRKWVQSGVVPPFSGVAVLAIADWQPVCGHRWATMAPSGSPVGVSQLLVPSRERQGMIRRFHDSLFAGHLGISRNVSRGGGGGASTRELPSSRRVSFASDVTVLGRTPTPVHTPDIVLEWPSDASVETDDDIAM